MGRNGHLIVAVVFVLFAVVQWNDRDYLIWIPVYMLPAVAALLAYFNRYYRLLYLGLCAVLLLWMASYLPHMANWIREGMPNIAGSMKADTLYIELTREFFGLFLCTATIWYYYILSKRK